MSGAGGGEADAEAVRLYLRFGVLVGVALALAGGAGLWVGRGHATHRAQLAVWQDAAFMAERLGRDDLARTALTRPAVGDRQLLLDDLFGQAAVAPGIVRVSLFQPDGVVTYSSVHDLIGGSTDEPRLLHDALEHGRAWAVGNAAGRRVLVSYVPVHWLFSPDGRPTGALAVYRDYAPVAREIRDDLRTQALVTAVALLLLYAALFPILRGVTRTLADRNRRLARQAGELRRLAAIVESSGDAIVGASPEGTITSWNDAAERVYGWAAAEAVGRPVSLFVPKAEAAGESFAAIHDGRAVIDHHAVHVRRDGSQIDVFLTISPVRDADGRLAGASMIARDVTDRLELERRLRRTQRAEAVGRLAGGIAHDFNNLLTGIASYADLAARELPAGSSTAWHVEEIRKAIARGAALTGQLLDFEGRREIPAAGRRPERDRGADAAAPAPRARRGRRARGRAGRGRPARRRRPDPARAAGRDTGAERARRERRGRRDRRRHGRGRGRRRPDRPRLRRRNRAQARARAGGALGARAGERRHRRRRGRAGRGHERPRLAAARGGPRRAGPAGRARARGPGRCAGPATILLVEDEEIVRAVVREVLEDAGHVVVAAHHGRQALELCAAHEGPIDVLVTDVVMPELGGVELATAVRELHPEVAVVLMSGYPDREVTLDGTPTRWLQKPFSHGELTAEVDAALAGRPVAAG